MEQENVEYTEEEISALMEELLGQLQSIKAENMQTVRSLTARGKNVPPALTLLERINTLITVMLGDMDAPSRVAFEIQFERNMAANLDQLDKTAIREALLRR